jgi:hypothetical protein
MSQFDLSTLSPSDSGNTLVSSLDSFSAAFLSNNSGATRPSYAVEGTKWTKIVSATLREVYYYDGDTDFLLFTYNPVANTFVIDSDTLNGFADYARTIVNASDPGAVGAYNYWIDTTAGLIKQRNAANSGWITIGKSNVDGLLLTGSGNPNGVVTGNFEGQQYYDTTNDLLWVYAGSSTNWFPIGSKQIIASKTSNYTATIYDDVILCDATSGSLTITLYAASGNAGRRLTILKTDSSTNTVTIDGNASETIDGALTTVIYPNQTITLICDGSNWKSIKEQGKGRVLIEEKIASSSASIEFTRGLDGSFPKYEIELFGVVPATTDSVLHLRTSSNGGSSYDAGASNYVSTNFVSSFTNTSLSGGALTVIEITNSTVGRRIENGSAQGLSGTIQVEGLANTTRVKRFVFNMAYRNTGGGIERVTGSGNREATSIVNAILFFFGSGNIASGTFRLYGVN